MAEKNYKDNAIERWLAFLEKDISEDILRELVAMEPAIKKAENKLEHLSSDEETMSIYYAREKSLHDQANMVNSAEQRGRMQGIEQGRQEGRKEGMKEGIKQVAISLLDILDDNTIAEKTGITIAEVRLLRNNHLQNK